VPTVTRAEKWRILAATPLFRAFPADQMERLAGRLHERTYADGETVFLRGDEGRCMHIVMAGRVRISVTATSGREILFRIVEPGEVFGEMALLDGLGRSADASAFGETTLLALDRVDFLPVLRDCPDCAIGMLELLSDRLRSTSDQLEGVALMALVARLARLLLTLAETHGKPAPGGVRIETPLTQRDLGQLIGASREKVNLQLGRWVADGVLIRDGAALIVADADYLQDIVDAGEE
jgi:CRP/FNR family cyclic AMP-dependent transcriptional regulator